MSKPPITSALANLEESTCVSARVWSAIPNWLSRKSIVSPNRTLPGIRGQQSSVQTNATTFSLPPRIQPISQDVIGFTVPNCNGVKLNCGCPKNWAIGKGTGCALMELMEEPELVKTEAAAVAYIAVYERTLKLRSTEPANFEAIRTIKEHENFTYFPSENADQILELTHADGVIVILIFSISRLDAWGLLEHPGRMSSVTPQQEMVDSRAI
ncbi:hypothetical protein BC830DRAFT_365034 [Chytriomyces sp. MP71]|nr:hypothetical protein BC830DRAFT_365034 [Chytriomyces sp. MP71]